MIILFHVGDSAAVRDRPLELPVSALHLRELCRCASYPQVWDSRLAQELLGIDNYA